MLGALAFALWSSVLCLQVRAEDPPQQDQNLITMNFQDVDIPVLAKFISEITGRNFVIDESVRGKVTIISPTKVTPEQAYSIFQSVLQVKGFTTVQAGKVIKIVPGFDRSFHQISNFDIHVEGDAALSRSMVSACHRLDGELWEQGGLYEHDLVKLSVGWRIRHQTYTQYWERGRDLSREAAERLSARTSA